MTAVALRELLDAYRTMLVAAGEPAQELLRPGPPEHEIRQRLFAAGFPAPQQLLDWFGWCEGVHDSRRHLPECMLGPTVWAPMPLDDAIEASREERGEGLGLADSNGVHPDTYWPPTWIILGAFDGAYLVADAASNDGVRCSVRSVKFLGEIPLGTSISTVVRYWMTALDAGCAHWDPEVRRWLSRPWPGDPWPAPLEPGFHAPL